MPVSGVVAVLGSVVLNSSPKNLLKCITYWECESFTLILEELLTLVALKHLPG